jgi:hypothetical protein
MLTIINEGKIVNSYIMGIHTKSKQKIHYDIQNIIFDSERYRIKLREPFLGYDKVLYLHRKESHQGQYSKEKYYKLEDMDSARECYIAKTKIKDMQGFINVELKTFLENI